MWASSSGQTQDARAASTFFSFFCVLSVDRLSERAKKKQKIEHESRTKSDPRSSKNTNEQHSSEETGATAGQQRRARKEKKPQQGSSENQRKNRPKIDEKTENIDQKSMKNRSWGVLGVQRRFGCASGRARDSSWTAKNRPKTDLETPRASQERPTASQIRPRDGFESLPDRFGTLSERVWNFEHCRTTSPNDFFTFFGDRAKAPMCFLYQFLQCFVEIERS